MDGWVFVLNRLIIRSRNSRRIGFLIFFFLAICVFKWICRWYDSFLWALKWMGMFKSDVTKFFFCLDCFFTKEHFSRCGSFIVCPSSLVIKGSKSQNALPGWSKACLHSLVIKVRWTVVIVAKVQTYKSKFD